MLPAKQNEIVVSPPSLPISYSLSIKFNEKFFSFLFQNITDAGPLACTSCPSHFMLDNGLCIECLGSQFYDPPTQQCKTCHESCRSCSGPGQYSCVTCAFPLHLDRLNNQCVPCCPTDALPEDQSCCHCDKDTGEFTVWF